MQARDVLQSFMGHYTDINVSGGTKAYYILNHSVLDNHILLSSLVLLSFLDTVLTGSPFSSSSFLFIS